MSVPTARPLFVFGVARSGTNLLARVLDAHPAVEIALDPFMPLFRVIRNAIIANDTSAAARAGFDPDSPFHDGYQTPQGYKRLDTLLASDLSAPVDPAELPRLRAAVAARAALEASDIATRADRIAGATCRELISSALEIVAACRATASTRYVGIKEVWVLDFLPALARAFPETRFLAIERDPRAVIASLAALAARDPGQQAHPISYLRHWRKSTVLARRFAAEASLVERFRLVRYEDLASRPGETARELADFLALPFDPVMLAPATASGVWRANSSYRDTAPGISDAPVARWRHRLPVATIRAVEFFCWPEMALARYPCTSDCPATGSDDIAAYVASADADPGSWRSDSGDVAAEMSFEALRCGLLERRAPADIDLIRRCFLFESTYRATVAAQRGLIAPRSRAMS
jgi:hypothetical protein